MIHLACPDYNAREASVKEAYDELTDAYTIVLREFAKSEGVLLRMAPISAGAFAGGLDEAPPALTSQALTAGWMKLEQEEVEMLSGRAIQICVWLEREYMRYEAEFV